VGANSLALGIPNIDTRHWAFVILVILLNHHILYLNN